MENCIFCKIIRQEIPSEIIHETDNAIAFLDVNPRAPGHTLVIPKTHAEGLADLDKGLVGEIFLAVKHVEKLLKDALKPDAFTIGINEGAAAGQEIPHLHVNIIPRFKNDGGSSVHSVVNNPPDKELRKIAASIRQ